MHITSFRSLHRRIAGLLTVALAILGLTVAGSTAAQASTASQFSAPLTPGYGADPSMAYYNGNYYLLYNQGVGNQVIMRKAGSLAGLKSAANIPVYTADANTGCCDVGFGGFLFHYSGRWYIYGAGDDGNVNNSQQFVLQSSGDDPLGPYSFAGTFAGPGPYASGYAINPFIANGQLYATSTSSGRGTYHNSIYIAKMSSPTTLSSSWSLIAAPASSGWECAAGRCIDEGSSIIIRNGVIYDLFSAGGYESPDYCVGMLTASATAVLTSASSWTKSSGCVVSRNDSAGAYGPGSMTWFTSPDSLETWVIYHVKTTSVNSDGSDRVLEAAKVTWGTGPILPQPYAVGSFQSLPSGDPGVAIYEAEAGAVTDAQIRSSTTASGGQYVGGIDNPDSSVSFPVTAPAAGVYTFRVYYSNAYTTAATQALTVNGTPSGSVTLPVTSQGWGTFRNGNMVTIAVNLASGSNTIKLAHSTGYAELDRLELATDDGYEAENALIVDAQVRSSTSASGSQYVGRIDNPDSAVTFDRVTVANAGNYTIRVYFSNQSGSAATQSLSVNGGAPTTLSYPNVGTWGSFDPLRYVSTSVSLNAGTNTVKLSKGTLYTEVDRIVVL